MSLSTARDFRFRSGEDVDGRIVIDNPQWTLYCLDARRGAAVFVETPADIDLPAAPFYYQAQSAHAQRAIVVPLADFHITADEKGDRFQRAVMVHSVGRCGSTLLSKMFASLRQCVSLSEPDVQTQLLAERFPRSQIVPLLRSAARHYFQPHGPATHLVMKFRSFCIELAADMETATPGCASIFLYRDIERVVTSGMRAFRYRGAPLWTFDRWHRSRIGIPLLAAALAWNRDLGRRLFPVSARFTAMEIARFGPVGFLAVAWVSAMERAAALIDQGIALLPLRYDDLVARPEIAATLLLDYCGLSPTLVPQMLSPLAEDSQAGSTIERRRQQTYELSPRDRAAIRDVLSCSDIIDSGEFQLPGTIAASAA